MRFQLKNKFKQWFCRHHWKYWDFVGELKHGNHVREIHLPNKFRKCTKCGKRQKMNTMPNTWGRFENTNKVWNEDYPIVGKITKDMKREARLKKLLNKDG